MENIASFEPLNTLEGNTFTGGEDLNQYACDVQMPLAHIIRPMV